MPKITEIYAFIATEGPDDEGIPAFSHGEMFFPMVGADKARVESLRQRAQELGMLKGAPRIRLVKFTTMVELGDVSVPPDEHH